MLFRRAVSKSNTKILFVGVPMKSSELAGVSQIGKKITRLDEDEKLAELISAATRKDWEPLRWWTFWRAWGVYSNSLSLRMSLLMRLDVTSVISSAVPF